MSIDHSVSLVHNQGTTTHQDVVRDDIKDADTIYIAVAFMKKSGQKELLAALENALRHGATANVIIATNFYITEPAALIAIWELCERYSPKACAYLITQSAAVNDKCFHPKAYCAVRGQNVTMVLGSANATHGGLCSNYELSFRYCTDFASQAYQDFKNWFETQRDRAKRIEEKAIEEYRRSFDVYERERKKAELNMRRAGIIDFVWPYLEEYNASSHEQDDFKTRQRNYEMAAEVLDDMISSPPKDRNEFLHRYGKLVGDAESRKLWHSNGIHRHKGEVADQHQAFIRMLGELKNAIRSESRPDAVFKTGISHADGIRYVGPNVVTEIMNTYDPKLYPVLNNNPIESLNEMGILAPFPAPSTKFPPETFVEFTELLEGIRKECGLQDLSHVDHFLNFVYQRYVKKK